MAWDGEGRARRLSRRTADRSNRQAEPRSTSRAGARFVFRWKWLERGRGRKPQDHSRPLAPQARTRGRTSKPREIWTSRAGNAREFRELRSDDGGQARAEALTDPGGRGIFSRGAPSLQRGCLELRKKPDAASGRLIPEVPADVPKPTVTGQDGPHRSVAVARHRSGEALRDRCQPRLHQYHRKRRARSCHLNEWVGDVRRAVNGQCHPGAAPALSEVEGRAFRPQEASFGNRRALRPRVSSGLPSPPQPLLSSPR